jgi:hypothetical protein
MIILIRHIQKLATLVLVGIGCATPSLTSAESCVSTNNASKTVYWGDLHVHTQYSLDAYAFGATATPDDAYRYARGEPLTLANGRTSQIDRPLDFAAVTDHAATFDLLYLCTDPMNTDNDYCRTLREARDNRDGRTLFNDYLLPIVGATDPAPAAICNDKNFSCSNAMVNQWQRTQRAANEANEPCAFTALIGYEWTASPGGRHWHRNVIFRGSAVTQQPIDYVRYPEVSMLWQQLDAQCKAKDDCHVLTIPHNINWADGGPTFGVESEDSTLRTLRAKFERLAEMHQEKGNSECMPEDPNADVADCGFERVIENAAKTRLSGPSTVSAEEAWQQTRSSYYRTLLGRGLQTYQRSEARQNPLMLGAIASTDNHFGTAGRVAEAGYRGSIASLFSTDEQVLNNTQFNPGGLVAVWANSNTRGEIFDALYRREAYATSGPRISLQFSAGSENACATHPRVQATHTAMGGTLPGATQTGVYFTVSAQMDQAPLAKLQLVKGELWEGELRETVFDVFTTEEGQAQACVAWLDEDFNPNAPSYWYARASEVPTPRWSKLLCESLGKCGDYPEADRMIEERAWSSPIWHLP